MLEIWGDAGDSFFNWLELWCSCQGWALWAKLNWAVKF